ncbi:MAG: metalloregulator ArsR/SmtB family transcription factor [Paenibacillus sp.]|uniref:ArsR/SmtB family transcription factor n=1 Tax=Paenibacillus sp. TaxID=58172 RepID=UPI0029023206|nr:metalloregulator ArsR/SmtB family transcription factor [Paenibacillus sp.]MDU2242815.1 metalloregulator ArsR/SmtB family transcription factor [Paenibacillus sp.]
MAKITADRRADAEGGGDVNIKEFDQLKIQEQTADALAELFKALGDPTRLKMIYALLNDELCVHDLCTVLEMNQSAISHQLRYLRNVRIVKRRKVGKTVYYSLDDEHVREVIIQTMNHLKHG